MIEIYLPMSEYYSQLLLPGFTPKLQLQLEYKANYQASELPEDIQEKICSEYREDNPDYPEYEWWDWAYEGFKEDMKKIGFDVDDIYFSGFYSQGDGACFEGSISDRKLFFEKMVVPHLQDHHRVRLLYDNNFRETLLDELSCSTKHDGHYCHSGCMDVNFELATVIHKENGDEEETFTSEDFQALERAITDELREEADDLYKTLEKEYDYLISDKGIIEMLDANDHYFYLDGKKEDYYEREGF